jgi:hypothetical protein
MRRLVIQVGKEESAITYYAEVRSEKLYRAMQITYSDARAIYSFG